MAEQMDLSFVTTDELLDELTRRSSALVVGMVTLINPNQFIARCNGSILLTLGLMQIVVAEVNGSVQNALNNGKGST